MIAIILAAGRGTRMKELTDNCPKPMLSALGKNLIEWKLESLPEEVVKVVIVVGYLKEQIQNYFGNSWNGITIEYVNQENPSGTGMAIELCKSIVKDEESFMVLMGDDIYSKEDLLELTKNKYSILVANQGEEGRKKGWQVFFDENNFLTEIHQKISPETSPYINAGAYCLGKEIFDIPLQMMENGEYSLPHALIALIKEKQENGDGLPVRVVVAKSWIQITSPESIKEAEEILK